MNHFGCVTIPFWLRLWRPL